MRRARRLNMVSPLLPEILSLRRGQAADDVADPRVDVVGDAVAAVQAANVREYVEALPPRERDVISARFGLDCEPQSHHTIARRLQLAVGTVWNIERRALVRLRYLDDRCSASSRAA
jgi:DNA-directed RNA polymerase sigma subunit (sigma70/sigma32)